MNSFALYLVGSDKQVGSSVSSTELPIWAHIKMRIDRAFRFGGRVELRSQDPAHIGSGATRTPWWVYTVAVAMEAKEGQYRIVVTTQPSDERFPLREWWEQGDSPFHGTVLFGDDEFDARTVCRDVSIAKQIFRDFFDHGELTEFSFSQMRSYYNPKPA